MKFSLFIILTFFSAITSAADAHGPITTVKYIYTKANGNSPFIRFGSNSMPGCYGDNGGYLSVSDVEGGNRIYSLILAAYMSQKPVSVYYDYTNTDPNYNGWGKCTITAVDLK